MKLKNYFLLFFLFLILINSVSAEGNNTVRLYLFYSETCPHCKAEISFLEKLQPKYPQLIIEKYEVIGSRQNAELFFNLSKACGVSASGVPATFIGDDVIIGFDNEQNKGKEIEDRIKYCIENGCIDAMDRLSNASCKEHGEGKKIITLPFAGEVDTSKISLPLFTLIIAGLDSINPCAIWVLCFLLTLLIYANSRKKILFIGGMFVLASGIVYFIFMTAWLNLFLFVGYVNILRILIALVAIVMGAINIKDFFFFKKGISLSIPDSAKPKLFARMRQLVHSEALVGMVIGTIVLAFTSNLIELACTAGFPAIYTRVLTMQNLSVFGYYSYLALYNLIYVIPLAIIVAIFAITMGKRKFEEHHGRILKLIGGSLMLILGIILMFWPQLLSFG